MEKEDEKLIIAGVKQESSWARLFILSNYFYATLDTQFYK